MAVPVALQDAPEGAQFEEGVQLTQFAGAAGASRARTAGASGGSLDEDAAAPNQPSPSPDDTRRLMIYTARFKLLVANVRDALGAFLKKVEELGGYLQTRDDASVTCRVPAKRFQECLAALPAFGAVLSESVSAQDVTKQYLDLGLRIENAEKARLRLLALLEKADKVDDILKIEQEIRRLTEEIERLKGELKYLAEQIAYSTVEVQFQSTAPEARPVFKRARSRFYWINQIGVEHALQAF